MPASNALLGYGSVFQIVSDTSPDLYVELMSLHDVEMPREVRQKCSSAMVVVCPPEHQDKLQSKGSTFLQSLLEESRSLKRA